MKLYETIRGESPLFFVGASKNAGKTTAMNSLLQLYRKANNGKPAILSAGIDGEKTDALFGHKKPAVYIKPGDIFCTTAEAIEKSDCDSRILAAPKIGAGKSRIVIAEALSAGTVLIVGPDTNSQLESIIENSYNLGADKLFIDGAFDRKTQISLKRPVHVVLAAMPAPGENADAFAARLAAIAKLYTLPKYRGAAIDDLSPNELVIRYNRHTKKFNSALWKSMTGNERNEILKGASELLVGGALTEKLLDGSYKNLPQKIVVTDPSRIFLPFQKLELIKKNKIKLFVFNDIMLKLIAVRSVMQNRQSLPPKSLLKKVAKKVKPVEVYDFMLAAES